MSSPATTNVIGPIDRDTWYTMRELRSNVREFRTVNVNGLYDDNIAIHNQAINDMMQQALVQVA